MFFDSLSHPTLDGTWIGGKPGETFADVAASVVGIGGLGACAVGLPGVGNYDHHAYFDAARAFPQLYPVAAYTGRDGIARDVEVIARTGFKAFKIHPRLLGMHPRHDMLTPIFAAARDNGLTVFLCTYYHDRPGRMMDDDPYWHLVKAINRNQETRIVLVHGGGIRVLEYAELCRFSPNLLLDLSFTVEKYRHSSVSQNIAFLFETFDRKVCVGSDSPEYNAASVAGTLEYLTTGLRDDKKHNILSRNITTFLGLDLGNDPAPRISPPATGGNR